MRINELINENDNLEEGPLANKIGTAVGKGVGTLAKGAGAVAGGIAGLGAAAKKGYQAGKATVASGGDDEADPAAAGAAQPAAGGTAAAPADGAAQPAADAPAAGGPGGLKGLWQNFKKGWAQSKGQAPADQTAAPAAGGTAATPAAGAEPAAATPAAQPAAQPAAGAEPAAAAPASGAEQPAAGAPAAGAKPNPAAQPAAGAEPAAEKPAAAAAPAAGSAVDQAKAGVDALKPQQQQQLAKDLGAGAAQPAAGAAQPAAGAAAKPAAAGGQNAAANDTFEKAKADIRKVQSGTKPLPDNMIQGVQADIAKMAKGDKESGVFAAQKIMGFAQKGYDIAALQQAWNGNAKAGQRFLSQSVYRAIDKMLKENKLTWADLGLQISIFESVSDYVGVSYVLSNKLQENVEKHKRKMFESSLSKGEFSIFRK